MSRVLVAITGASGAIYGVRLAQRLLGEDQQVEVIVSDSARRVLAIEHDLHGEVSELLATGGRRPRVYRHDDVAALPASGSSAPDVMFVAPCSMGTAARLACGASTNLVERAADVMLKERRPLVLVPRETPLSTLHLRNLLTLSELGAFVVAASPAFYFGPRDIEDLLAFVVDRAIQCGGLDIPLRFPWTGVPD